MSNFIPTQDISTKLSLLNTYHDTILKEYRDNISELEFRDFTNEQNYYISKFKQGYPIGYDTYYKARLKSDKLGWHIAPLFAEQKLYTLNTKRLPTLTSVLDQIGFTDVCAINVLDPGQSLNWHIDKDYIPGVQLLRIIWGMDVSEGSCIQILNDDYSVETKIMKNKEFYIFHPQSRHRVENLGDNPRAVVCIDYIVDAKYRKSGIL